MSQFCYQKKSTKRNELKLKHELLICKTISSPNMITIRHLNRRIFRPICNLFFRDDKLCHHFNPPVCAYWKKPQNRVNCPWKKNIQREEKEKEKGLFYFTMAFFDQKIDEKRTMLPKFFHNDYDCPQINQMLETKNKKNELFWLIILSTTLSDFGDNFGIERWNEKKLHTLQH